MENCSLRFTGSFAYAQDDRGFYTFAVIPRSEATKNPVLIHFSRLLLPLTTPQSLSATAPLTRGAFLRATTRVAPTSYRERTRGAVGAGLAPARLPKQKTCCHPERIAGRRCRGQRKADRNFRSRAVCGLSRSRPANGNHGKVNAKDPVWLRMVLLFTGFFTAARFRMTGWFFVYTASLTSASQHCICRSISFLSRSMIRFSRRLM